MENEMVEQGNLSSPHCPAGLTACLIGSEKRSGYEVSVGSTLLKFPELRG